MQRYLMVVFTITIVFAAVLFSADAALARVPKLMEFDSMVGVPQGLTGGENPIRGINGGGLPWSIGPSYGILKADGRLGILVNDLVFAAGPNAGKNTVANFKAVVSCLQEDGSAVNVSTGLFPATVASATDPGGDAVIQAQLVLPQTCIAPIIFVTSPGGAWFATTGK